MAAQPRAACRGEQGGCRGSHQISLPWFAGTVLTHSWRAGAVRGVSWAGGLGMNFHQPKDLVSSVISHHGWDLVMPLTWTAPGLDADLHSIDRSSRISVHALHGWDPPL